MLLGLLPHLLARQLPKSRHDGRQSGSHADADDVGAGDNADAGADGADGDADHT